ncbi:type II toxin-antitoxin system prevent-host-death family antitoxin [Streptomyces sp. ME19-01-6]|uniref:type II toxin-antitoxin system prevent-host-death family antitoxin n=1 Tax=Streptomyces sp. ME19-01-6 TaxID=3028686 RepID=UPI0029B70EAA|nr:type II toxin-antitoxin system prevent-host-death family antitoxin [Streptomyces sp. ME19-01-6]MDX3232491.1 type II toxin-antitoxin system prevent-host-death family antitoxin [Streptomyces sp. ME19-01-6]
MSATPLPAGDRITATDLNHNFPQRIKSASDGRPQHISRNARPAVVIISATQYAQFVIETGAISGGEQRLTLTEAKHTMGKIIQDVREQQCAALLTKRGALIAAVVPAERFTT